VALYIIDEMCMAQDLKNSACGLSNLVLEVDGWVQENGSVHTGCCSRPAPPVKHSLRKQVRGPRRKQEDMGVANHS